MKLSELKKKLAKMTDEQIEDYVGDMRDRGKYEKIELDGPYAEMFDFDPDDGTISWECEEHGYCEADLMDLFMGHGKMLACFEEKGCGLC